MRWVLILVLFSCFCLCINSFIKVNVLMNFPLYVEDIFSDTTEICKIEFLLFTILTKLNIIFINVRFKPALLN